MQKYKDKQIDNNFFIVDDELSAVSNNPISNKAIYEKLQKLDSVNIDYGIISAGNYTSGQEKTSSITFNKVFSEVPFLAITPICNKTTSTTRIGIWTYVDVNNISNTGAKIISVANTALSNVQLQWVAIGK